MFWGRGKMGNGTCMCMYMYVYTHTYVSSISQSTSSTLGSESASNEAIGRNILGLEIGTPGLEFQLCCCVSLVTCSTSLVLVPHLLVIIPT